jgi:hypothetical protein
MLSYVFFLLLLFSFLASNLIFVDLVLIVEFFITLNCGNSLKSMEGHLSMIDCEKIFCKISL